VDIIPIKPSKRLPYNILITMGMSALPMQVPPAYYGPRYSELMIILPPDWKISQKFWRDKKYFWPFSILTKYARYPHANKTFLNCGHTITNGVPPVSFAENTELSSVLIDKPRLFDEEFAYLETKDKKVYFFTLIPIYEEERRFAIQFGSDELFRLFEINNVSQVVDINRKNICKDLNQMLNQIMDSLLKDEEYT